MVASLVAQGEFLKNAWVLKKVKKKIIIYTYWTPSNNIEHWDLKHPASSFSSFSSASLSLHLLLCPSFFFLLLPKHPYVSISFLFFCFCFMCLLVYGYFPSAYENKIFEKVESKTITRVELECFENFMFLFCFCYDQYLSFLFFLLNVLMTFYLNIKVNFGVFIF